MATNLTNTEVLLAAGLPSDMATKLRTAQGNTYTALANQFVDAIVNKIVYQKVETVSFSNPFKKYDSFPVTFGDTIENVYVDKVVGRVFKKDNTNPFEIKAPNVVSSYVSINYEMQYLLTVEDKLLKRACLNEYGFMGLINTLVESLAMSRDVDEYTATIIMLNNSNIYKGGFEQLAYANGATDSEIANIAVHKIVDTMTDFQLPSFDNNKKGVLASTDKSHLLLVIKQSLYNKINLDYLSGVFNLSKTELTGHIIPVRSFKATIITTSGQTLTPSESGDDIDFVIVDTRGFDNHVALSAGETIRNPANLSTNHFSNLWKIISYRLDFQARAYKMVKAS